MLLFLLAPAFAAPALPWFYKALDRLRVPWEEMPRYHAAYTEAAHCMQKLRINGKPVLHPLFQMHRDVVKELETNPEAFLPSYRAFLLAYQGHMVKFCRYKGPLPYASWENQPPVFSPVFEDMRHPSMDGSIPQIGFFPRKIGRTSSSFDPRTDLETGLYHQNLKDHSESNIYFTPETTYELLNSKHFMDFSHLIRHIYLALVYEIWDGNLLNAVFDPAYFLFLANIDRLWSKWQRTIINGRLEIGRLKTKFSAVFHLNPEDMPNREIGNVMTIDTIYITANPPLYVTSGQRVVKPKVVAKIPENYKEEGWFIGSEQIE